jgi:hypothetical protein
MANYVYATKGDKPLTGPAGDALVLKMLDLHVDAGVGVLRPVAVR